MRLFSWEVQFGLSLILLSVVLYLFHYALFEDARHIILWTTTSSDSTLVRVSEPDGTLVGEFPAVIDEDSQRAEFDQYNTEVIGLEPSRIYCYQIEGEDGLWLDRTGFRTAPATGDSSSNGARSAAAISPSQVVEWVSSQASHPTATRCIHVEMACGPRPIMNSA